MVRFQAAGGQFHQSLGNLRNDADAPTLGIQDVFQRTLAGNVIVNDQYSDFGHGWVSLRAPIKYIGDGEG